MTSTKFITSLLLLILPLLSFSQEKELWGTTRKGGTNNAGTIYKTDTLGENYSEVHSFFTVEGYLPYYLTLVEGVDNLLYGATRSGGNYGDGVVFSYDPSTDQYQARSHFDETTLGGKPFGSLMLASDGLFYGMTNSGGANGFGTLFQFNSTTNQLVVKYDFDGINGASPEGDLIQASNGLLFGMTADGGTNDFGTAFTFNISIDAYTKILDLDSTNTGRSPRGKFVEDPGGLIYGLTRYGGNQDEGVLFSLDPTTYATVKKVDFGGVLGRNPLSHMMLASNGIFYGTTAYGGNNDEGTIFSYVVATDSYTVENHFLGELIGELDTPYGGLIEAPDGLLYGCSEQGGVEGDGTIYSFNPTSSATNILFSFDDDDTGRYPAGSLMLASNGKMYATNIYGGSENDGTLFEFDYTLSQHKRLLDFSGSVLGHNPVGNLFKASNGMIYGITSDGGDHGDGVLYEYNLEDNTFAVIKHMKAAETGSWNDGYLFEHDAVIYGVGYFGGSYNDGALYSYDLTTGVFLKHVDFQANFTGDSPYGSLVEFEDYIYGTLSGGMSNYGSLFRYKIATGLAAEVYTFEFATGGTPQNGLIVGSNGSFWGVAKYGGNNSSGVVYEFNPDTWVYDIKGHFDNPSSGKYPATLLQASDGNFYGTTSQGGAYGDGTIFRYDTLAQTLDSIYSFDGLANGDYAVEKLVEVSGIIYGVAQSGGTNDNGILYSYDISLDLFTKKEDFDDQNASTPRGGLVVLETCYPTTNAMTVGSCDSYTVPSGNTTYTLEGNYTVNDTITNTCGGDSILVIDLTIYQPMDSIDIDICKGSDYTYADGTISTNLQVNEVHTSILTGASVNGCDSSLVESLNLPLNTGITQLGNNLTSQDNEATYQWINCITDQIIVGATNQSFLVMNTGAYAVIVSENGCVDTSNCIYVTYADLLESDWASSVLIYPNPTESSVHIQFPNLEQVSIDVIAADGKIIQRLDGIKSNLVKVELNGGPGVYFIRVNSELGTAVQKVIKT